MVRTSSLLGLCILSTACGSRGVDDLSPRDAALPPADSGALLPDGGAFRTDTGLVNRAPVCTCTSSIEAEARQQIELSGSGCVDPDGDQLSYSWVVVARPPGSSAPLIGSDTQSPTIVLDATTSSGSPYVFQLTVRDSEGAAATCTISVFAALRRGLSLELTWDRDLIDLDLHLLDPTGSADPLGANGWFNPLHDCYYLRRNPDWGVAGDASDDPWLEFDDGQGFGPEPLSFPSPAPGTYTVGVHESCGNGRAPTIASVRVFCDGVLTATMSQALDRTGLLWRAAQIDWPGCIVRTSTEIVSVAQGCL